MGPNIYLAIQAFNFIQNHLVRGDASRFEGAHGPDHAQVQFFPWGCSVSAVGPRHKSEPLGSSKWFSLVGYSSKHFGGYQLLDWTTEKIVVRGDIHCLTFHPTRFRHKEENARPKPREEEGAVIVEIEEEKEAQDSPPFPRPTISSSSFICVCSFTVVVIGLDSFRINW